MESNEKFSLSLSIKQVFLAGIAAGALGVAALGFILTVAKGGSLDGLFSGSARISGDALAAPSAPLDPGATGDPVGTVAPVSDQDHIRGDKNAKVTLLEYSDYQCPFCQRFHPTMKQALEEYKGKVRWVYRHFPLSSIHPYAKKAAEAAECASEQGKFWELSDLFFEKQNEWAQSGLDQAKMNGYAQQAGVRDVKKFESCVTSGKYAQRVASDLASGEAAGVTGTPGTIVLGPDGEKQLIPGALPYDAVKQIIDSLL